MHVKVCVTGSAYCVARTQERDQSDEYRALASKPASQPFSDRVDHLTGKIFTMGLTGVTPSAVHAHLASANLHHKANTIGSGHVADDPAFLMEIAKAVEACTEVLILGPGTEKTALTHYLQSTHPQIALRVE